MNNKLILITIENCELDRLNMYHDFVERISLQHENVKVYGHGYHGQNPKYITTYDPSKSIHDVIDKDLGGQVPDVIFLMNAAMATSDFTGLKSKVYVFTSDSVITNKIHVATVMKHKFKCEGVFYNYLYGQNLLEKTFMTDTKFYFPCWASSKYDYEKYHTPKTVDFFMSGLRNKEYSYRYTFSDIFRGSQLNFVDRFDVIKTKLPMKEDHDVYTDFLGKSRYSPHDGGIHGRMQGRFYESGFMKSVIIAPDLGEEMRRNGFDNGVNCVLFDRNKPVEEVRGMLTKIDELYEWENLSNNAYDLIKNRHTTDHRIKYFLETVLT